MGLHGVCKTDTFMLEMKDIFILDYTHLKKKEGKCNAGGLIPSLRKSRLLLSVKLSLEVEPKT